MIISNVVFKFMKEHIVEATNGWVTDRPLIAYAISRHVALMKKNLLHVMCTAVTRLGLREDWIGFECRNDVSYLNYQELFPN